MTDRLTATDEPFPCLEKMRLALDELHGGIIRRPEPTSEVRKEFLDVALRVLDAEISRQSTPN